MFSFVALSFCFFALFHCQPISNTIWLSRSLIFSYVHISLPHSLFFVLSLSPSISLSTALSLVLSPSVSSLSLYYSPSLFPQNRLILLLSLSFSLFLGAMNRIRLYCRKHLEYNAYVCIALIVLFILFETLVAYGL